MYSRQLNEKHERPQKSAVRMVNYAAGGNVPDANPASGVGPNLQVPSLKEKGVRFSGLPADGEGYIRHNRS